MATPKVRAYAGEPRSIDGVGRERLAYAPAEGVWRTELRIGASVAAGQIVGHVGETPVVAPIGGALRGLTRNGVPVARSAKIVEVDPRGAARALLRGLGERPRRIAGGVAAAVSRLDGA
jgi:xanthine dehydrogenase accessory factor